MAEIKKLTIRGSVDQKNADKNADSGDAINQESIDLILEEFKQSLMDDIDKKIQQAIKKINKR
jgi:hypothetical protein